MAEPLTTFAAAGNALQFVQLGIDLIRKTIEYSHGGGNIKLALKTYIDKPKIDSLSQKLDHARANLMLSLMVYLHDQSAVDRKNMSEGMLAIAQHALKTTAESGGRAHDGTYKWIFRRKEDDVGVWDDFIEWLHASRHPIYWVSGKPGSAKSTLIRELDERADKLRSLDQTADDAEFLRASFCFWYAGTSDEKSLSGFLRVYQLLSPRLDLVDQVMSTSRWEANLDERPRVLVWEEVEVIEVLSRVVKHLETSKRVLLFIDGLDEHDGSDDQCQEVLELLHTLTKVENVRACVASRPYNIFRDEFHDCPQLRLDDLTKDNIRLYAQSNWARIHTFGANKKRTAAASKNNRRDYEAGKRGISMGALSRPCLFLRVLRDGGRTMHFSGNFKAFHSIWMSISDAFSSRLKDHTEKKRPSSSKQPCTL
ncbi:uncharacterized protein Z519_09584 [Cladophialophora bantiana CBS 173.52]|uniref:Nephrocystin 3-like N-terminal domain-containing protein n=1 Tax=Cladophialophora bantiana (strain ATCC 10958 / CBS 173.52 / CDC B-1940 / NIH 8579) TaxID=1442370 RepID=A0A0D2H7Z7_CLAB1|nr:uncharacterized protein Z519_09584 [Cladophialophora bantiana CBS 173.52]KIW89428.1 hypothetical protein Z519_09584 [Cladophialophora bantiana CBS 173.52]